MAKKDGFSLSFNSEAINEYLKANKYLLRQAAEDTKNKLEAVLPDDVPVDINEGIGENGRPYALVVITHPSGLARQAKDGVITKIIASQGIDINRYET